ncbi:3'-5' exonuclease [Erwinia mallotivora]|uniref:3'-5' exonuclease n=1 Tax=Erwinia mallotivora TaxID=69222 RepID=UPI0021C0457E|nr:3'-5' exonuclease [Erwinia mallotivora]
MNHLMIDLETMSNKPDAAIVAIGAVLFEPKTGELGAEFSVAVKLDSDMAIGGGVEGKTILWWMQKSTEARNAITSEDALPVKKALNALISFVSENVDSTRRLMVWGNGASFDNVILRGAFARCNMQPCWEWFNDLDVRTMVHLGRQLGFDPKREMPFDGERHNALADAIHQAKYVSAIWQKLFIPHQL